MNSKKIFATIVCALIALSAISLASADDTAYSIADNGPIALLAPGSTPDGTVYGSIDGGATIATTVPLRTEITIYWVSDPSGPVDLRVTYFDPNDLTQPEVEIQTWSNVAPTARGTYSFLADKIGTYRIHYDGVIKDIGVSSIFVVPESALGTLMALGVGFAVLGSFGLAKHKKNLRSAL